MGKEGRVLVVSWRVGGWQGKIVLGYVGGRFSVVRGKFSVAMVGQ